MDTLRTYLKGKRGRLTQLAQALGIGSNAISQWERVPAERVIDVERATGIPRNQLRPDIYPVAQPEDAA